MVALHVSTLAVVLVVAVIMDLRQRRIPNWVTVPGVLGGIIMGVFLEGGAPILALTGAIVALLVSFPLVALGGLGAGDAKLLAAVGAFVGPGGLLSVLVYGGLSGGLLVVVNTIRRGAFLGVMVNLKNLLVHWATLGRHGQRISLNSPGAELVPYALPIATGAILSWFFPLSLGS